MRAVSSKLIAACVICGSAAMLPAASVINTAPSSSPEYLMIGGDRALYGDPTVLSGNTTVTAFGQTFHVQPNASTVTGMTIYLDNNDVWQNYFNRRSGLRFNDPAEFLGSIVDWDSKQILYQSSYYEAAQSGVGAYTFSFENGLELDPAKQYVALFTGLPGGFDGSLGFANIVLGDNPTNHSDGPLEGEQAVFSHVHNISSLADLVQATAFLSNPRDLALVINGIVTAGAGSGSVSSGTINQTPEPSALLIWLGLSSLAIVKFRRKRRRSTRTAEV